MGVGAKQGQARIGLDSKWCTPMLGPYALGGAWGVGRGSDWGRGQ